ncbi:sensor histidine kinase [Pedobacter yulinensis]|uniref:histidine kinase n=1 Tax=Pedobacter yulinensis TaxID=2126353 RepID=A0A2T3HJC4_9SPHI|nr:HAMP domain-containing sensor histidine kinase [Pedobacter yulinensis]PST82555.1 sensor histidine kinase [Pedobacter yulinensis]
MTFKTKVTLLFFSMAAAGLVVLNAAIFYFVSQFNFEDFFKRLEARVNISAELRVSPDERSAVTKEVRNKYLEKLEDEKDYLIKLEPDGSLPETKPLQLPDVFFNAILKNNRARHVEDNRFYCGGLFKKGNEKYIVIVGASDPYGYKEIEELRKILIIGFIISLALVYVIAQLFSYYTINPLRNMIKGVRNITANNLHMRLEEKKGKDEISELTQTFNNMLIRLETAFETQNNFVSNASHELRTPLTIITSETELLLARKDLPEAARLSATNILNEAEKLKHILTSLLGLAQTGFDGKKQNWQKIRIDELLWQVIDHAKKIAPESQIQVNAEQMPEDENRLYTEGNVNLLQLALSNIVLNACKYSNYAEVSISITERNNWISVTVADKGIGIPAGEQQFIFDPFFRASNTNKFEGYGIGLPLTLNIIRLHKGSIGISSEENMGTEIQIMLPRAR